MTLSLAESDKGWLVHCHGGPCSALLANGRKVS